LIDRQKLYGIIDHMVAELVFRSKFIYPDGAIRDMVLWRLPKPTAGRSHGFKYRLHYSYQRGRAEIRYDNEKGKGDHRHVGSIEEPYRFTDVETLVSDFLSDIRRLREGGV
jgi:hypothetical protein